MKLNEERSTERAVTFQGGLNVAEEVRGRRIWLDRKVRLPIHGPNSTAFQFQFLVYLLRIRIRIKIQLLFSRSSILSRVSLSFGPSMGCFTNLPGIFLFAPLFIPTYIILYFLLYLFSQ